ncbi:single-stranded-DNA-specific exonuclease RecJ [Desulfosarcina ovata subsp. sediminis]|uniref:Single-stranded-DNA-specific exonuclease RecJ n=1 Tax=Desulfosarcina ovata subsp. sediminis TaxID=885957 RepID=A0A5K7ZM92_9BACT|nr:single-stranded-DNA-specific exonuclease RecJ [Desulfosarcina ovata]BBO79570.1 single-stranded-DNA-specific exonuclease RecJ [Desulfosarcina ovata subsp. sediminis]
MKKQWQIIDPDPQTVQRLTRQLSCHPLMARLLAIRGIQSKPQATRFLAPALGHLASPLEMTDMDQAVQRIQRALAGNEKILVFGDYDADGITATAVLVSFLRHCGARVGYYIPHRITDGYSMSSRFVTDRAKPAGVGLIITVDCGTSSAEAVTLARQLGIDTIVTDHHPAGDLPEAAVAVVNPTRPDCASGLSHLAGVGVAFYLVIALRAYLRKIGFWHHRREPNLKKLCDLVALGTVADVVPLIGENRVLTNAGLDQINNGARPGIAALMALAGSPDAPVDAEAIAFRLAPRINAAGRLAHARIACQLLLAEKRKSADRLARALCRLNSRRQSMENELFESIIESFGHDPKQLTRSVLVVDGPGWHEGILGIVASRLARQFNRPAVVIGTANGTAKGSARSVEGIDVSACLGRCADLLSRFGGHPQAAGLSLEAADIPRLRSRLNAVVETLGIDPGLAPPLRIDAELPLHQITPNLMAHLEELGPFGQGNPSPVFMATGIRTQACKTVGHRHRQMTFNHAAGNNGLIPAIQFNATAPAGRVPHFEKIAYRPQWNYWNGRKQLQLLIEDTDPGE